ncbi:hypothetical protein V6N13_002162 [Hibiscus sabdariffa]
MGDYEAEKAMQRDNVIKCCRPHSSLSQPRPQILLLLFGSCPVEGLGFLLLSLHFLRLFLFRSDPQQVQFILTMYF